MVVNGIRHMKDKIPDTLVHYYTNEEHLFRSVTSCNEDRLDAILDEITEI